MLAKPQNENKDLFLSISQQCKLLGISRSSYYYWLSHHEESERLKVKKFEEEKDFIRIVVNTWFKRPTYGYRKMSYHLQREGNSNATEKRIRRIYKQLGFQGLTPQFKSTRSGKVKAGKYPYLLRNRKAKFVNEIWATDITYIRLPKGMVFFTAVIDLYSRKILSWRLSNTMNVSFCIDCLTEALQKYGVPAIFNTDSGSQYTSEQFTSLLKKNGVLISMDGVGRCLDNIFVERTWRTLKYECIFLHDYNTMTKLREGIKSFIDYFNNERLHQSLEYQTPGEVYKLGCFPVKENDIQVA